VKNIGKALVLLVVLAVVFGALFWKTGGFDLAFGPYLKQEKVPTVFLHGLGGTQATFDTMIRQLEADGYGVLTDTYEMGGPTADKIDAKAVEADRPLIQVMFRDNAAGLDEQINWLTQTIARVKVKYETDHVNLVGHSMGGLLATKYVLETGGKEVQKLVTIGSPLNGSKLATMISAMVDKNALAGFRALLDLSPEGAATALQNLTSFNPDVRVLSVAGVMDTNVQWEAGQNIQDPEVGKALLSVLGSALNGSPGDGVVDRDSALLLRTVAKQFQSFECTGCFHSDIQSKPDVIAQVQQFLRAE